MQKSLRKILSLLLTLVMLLSMPLTVMAEEAVVSEETLPIVEEVAASETTESAELPSVEVPVTEEVVIEEVLVEEVPAVEEAPVVEAVVSAPVAVLAAVEEEAELFSAFSAQVGTYDAETETYAYGETVYTTFAEALAAAETAAAADTAADVVVSVSGEDVLAADINVSGNVRVVVNADASITAASEVVIDGGSNERIGGGAFFMVNAGKLTLENISIKNMTRGTTGSGGAINVQSDAEVIMTNGTLSGNSAQSGGALYSAGTVTLTNVTATGNESGGNGSVMFIGTGGSVTITNSVFEENVAVGAAVLYNKGALSIDNVDFINNEATGNGGAIFITSGGATLVGKNCDFTGNTSAGATGGGAIYSQETTEANFNHITLTDCTFTNNEATAANGGAIRCFWSNNNHIVKLTRCTFEGNTGAGTRGAQVDTGKLELTNCTFKTPYLLGETAGDIRVGATSPITCTGSNTLGSIATNKTMTIAGVDEANSAYVSIAENKADITVTIDDYDIGTYTYSVTVNDVPQEVSADGKFTIPTSTSASEIKVSATKNAVVVNYVATVAGIDDPFESLEEAIAAAEDIGEVVNVTLIGDVTYTEPTTITLNGLTRMIVTDEINISGPLTIQGNGEDASVLMFKVSGGKLTLDGVTLKNYVCDNSADSYGWIRVDSSGKLYLKNATIEGCSGKRGIYATSAGALVNAYNTTFKNNTSTVEYGGAIGLYGKAELVAESCTFTGNTATTSGGAIGNYHNATAGSTITLKNCTFSENVATGGVGGAIDVYGASTLTITGTNTLFSKNVSEGGSGGAICLQKNADLSIDGATFTGNAAKGGKSGGAIYQSTGECSIKNTKFNENTAENSAGAVYITNTTATTLTECPFMDNEAASSAGAVYWGGTATGTVEGCTFTGNKAGTYCGSIYPQANSTITLKGCSITGNHASSTNGYGLYLCGKSTLENVIVKDNTTDGLPYRQVAIYNNADVTIKGANNELICTTVSSANAKSINLAEGFGGTMTISFSDQSLHQKYLETADPVLPLFTGDGFAAAYAAGKITIENEAYSLLDNGHLKLKGIASVDGMYYPTVADAIMAIATEGTVVLADLDVEIVEEIFTMPGVTLDLNGQTVISEYPIIYNGSSIIDSTDGAGKLVCAKDDLVVPTDNKYLPIWVDEPDTEEGGVPVPGVDYYCFTALETINTKGSTAGGTYTYITRPEFNEDIAAMLGADGAAAHGLKVKILLKWDDSANTGYTEELPLVYTEDDVKAVYADNKAFYAYVTNYANYVDKSLEISVQVVSDTGVKFTVPATAIQE